MSLWTEEDVIARTVRQHEAQKAVSRPTAPIRATIRPRTTKGTADWSDALYGQLRALQLPLPEREYRFDASRKWRMDLAWVERKIYAECDGGEFTQGRHGRVFGMQSDCEKTCAAALAGWRHFRFVGSQIRSGFAIGILEKALR